MPIRPSSSTNSAASRIARCLGLLHRDLPPGLRDDAGQHNDERVAERLVLGVEQRGVDPHPLAVAAPRDQLEPGRATAVEEHPRQLALLPATPQVGGRTNQEQLQRVGFALQPGRADRLGGPMLLARLVVVEERQVEVGLAAEVVVEAADAGARLRHDVGDVGVCEAAGREHIARCRKQGCPGRLSATARSVAPRPPTWHGTTLAFPTPAGV